MPELTAGWVKQVFLFVCEYKKDAATTFVEQAGTTFQLKFSSLKLVAKLISNCQMLMLTKSSAM